MRNPASVSMIWFLLLGLGGVGSSEAESFAIRGECETAYAHGGELATCFLDLDEDEDQNSDFSHWGWTIGALSPGRYEFDIYAGAGQCDLGRATRVGTLVVDYNGTTASVTHDLDAPYLLQETHLYVGSEMLARNESGYYTVAPGQYPYLHKGLDGVTGDSYDVSGTGAIYLVAHAVVCGF